MRRNYFSFVLLFLLATVSLAEPTLSELDFYSCVGFGECQFEPCAGVSFVAPKPQRVYGSMAFMFQNNFKFNLDLFVNTTASILKISSWSVFDEERDYFVQKRTVPVVLGSNLTLPFAINVPKVVFKYGETVESLLTVTALTESAQCLYMVPLFINSTMSSV